MALVRWNPWNIDNFLEDFNLPTNIMRGGGQGLDLYETEDEFVAEAALPGIPEDNIDVTVHGHTVHISGQNTQKDQEKGKRRNYMTSLNTAYNYTFQLPEGIVSDQEPKCELNDGVLTMEFPLEQEKAAKKIKVSKRTNGGSGKKTESKNK